MTTIYRAPPAKQLRHRCIGIDAGATLVKAAWRRMSDDKLCFATTADDPLAEIIKQAVADGVTFGRRSGIGKLPADLGIPIATPEGNTVHLELRQQVRGVRALMGSETPSRFLLASVGTGTSYVTVDGEDVNLFPLGSPIGGGFIRGLAALRGIRTIRHLNQLANAGIPQSIPLCEFCPAAEDAKDPNSIVSLFGRVTAATTNQDFCATIMHAAAFLIAQDFLKIRYATPNCPTDVVCIGTVIETLLVFGLHLERYAEDYGFKLIIPPNAEFAGAVGALDGEGV